MTTQEPDKKQEIIMRHKKRVNWRSLVLTLSAIVVFVTTYLLILPAVTLDKEKAARQGGIDVAIEQTVDNAADAPTAAADPTADEAANKTDDEAADKTAAQADEESAGTTTEAGKEDSDTAPNVTGKADQADEGDAADNARPSGKSEQAGQTEKADQAAKDDKSDQAGKAEKTDQPDKSEKAEQEDKADKTDKSGPDDKVDKVEVIEKADSDAGDKGVKLLTGKKELNADLDESAGFAVSAIVDGANKVPEDVSLQAAELTKDTEGFDYDEHYKEALKVLKKDDSSVESISMIRFYDISLESDAVEGSVEPDDKVSVKIEYEKGIKVSDADNIRIIHFGEDKSGESKTEVLDTKDNKIETTVDKKNQLTEASFETDGFSEYAVAEVETIEKYVLTSDGQNYRISVEYPVDAGIPEGADLDVEEITAGSSLNGMSFEDYVANTEKALGWNAGDASFARVFDISIVSTGKKVQPADGKKVNVSIELADAGNKDEMSVVHFADGSDQPDVVSNVEVDGKTVSFAADGFSAYAIVEGPEPVELGWTKVENVSDLDETGFFIGSTQGYYFMDELVDDGSRIGIKKTKPSSSNPPTSGSQVAVLYYFEKVPGTDNQFYVYCMDGDEKKYVVANTNQSSRSLYFGENGDKDAFTIVKNSDGSFYIKTSDNWYWNMQGGASGSRFCVYNQNNDNNSKLYIWNQFSEVTSDPYGLDNTSHGLMYWDTGLYGKGLMAEANGANALKAEAMTVMAKANNSSQLFVADDSDISMWTFHWISDDKYYLTADNGTKYLKINSGGVSIVGSEAEASQIQVVPGTGVHEGQICLKSGDTTVIYSGKVEDGFTAGNTVGSEWLNLVELSELTPDYFKTYSARKVSVSDPSIDTGSKVIVYTRAWNSQTLKYEYYAIDHDGSLVRCYESGDSIEWVGSYLNTMQWQFTDYKDEGGNPTKYYELYNEYAQKYLAPQVTDDQIVADDPIGINMVGRTNGHYYSTILAWDDDNYVYSGLKVENGQIVACPKLEAMDFYFAVLEDIPVDDALTTVPTVDHTQYGITMKLVDFNSKEIKGEGCTSTDEQHKVMGVTKYTNWNEQPGLLSTNLVGDYPTATNTGKSLGELFANAKEVNHLFIQSTYDATGYYEFDSAQNYASLNGAASGVYTDDFDGNFTVYKELGTYDDLNKDTLKHGQFLPFNTIEAGRFASVNKQNIFSSTGERLPDDDPRKYENLYLVKEKRDVYFGVQLQASFTQTPSGLDDWGHDIIFEFTGDDDFWLYVDGELIIDLGGIHSALPGSVNFRTGEVKVNGHTYTLRELFEKNFKTRYKEEHGGAEPSASEINEYLSQYFDDGSNIFRDYSTHTMDIFYMERGGGASNLNMRFNLASVKPGTVELSKTLGGVDSTESTLAEFAYQIKYKKKGDDTEYYLSNEQHPGTPQDYVFYKNTTNPVTYKESMTIGGVDYNDVFILKPGETVVINFPTFGIDNEEIDSYSIVECGVNDEVYSSVKVNGVEVQGDPAGTDHSNYETGYATTKDRQRVNYENTVDPDALRTLTFRKKLYDTDGVTPINNDSTVFSFRLYLGTESDPELAAANMYNYHVKDPNGNYCRWDAQSQSFVSIGKSDYTTLSNDEKVAVTFSTSMNGAISKIPINYTVEVRQLLAGTNYRVQERPREIPDGYSFQKYAYYEDSVDGEGTGDPDLSYNAMAGVTSATETGKDPHVDICNLRGYGLRVNKVWTDEAYMSARDTTYFAIFVKKPNGEGEGYGLEDYVPGSLRAMPYGTSTLYWYWLTLPVDAPFDDYMIREVTFNGNVSPQLDPNDPSIVTNENALRHHIHWLREGEQFTLEGIQKGESESADFTYTVHYKQGTISENSNVRVDTVTNDRPGIILKKQDWGGDPLEGATFTLTEERSGTLIGTFTSESDGSITTAFLGEGKNYILEETATPQTYHGLEDTLTIKSENGTVTVNGSSVSPADGWYVLTQATTEHGITTPATLTIKNRPFTLQAVKQDGDTQAPLEDVHFTLYKQTTVDDHTDFVPVTGYEDLATDGNGVIPRIDNSLPDGVYQLREKATPSGYQPLPVYPEFTVSKTGAVSLRPSMALAEKWVTLTYSTETDGTLAYTMTIKNYTDASVTLKKVDADNTPLPGSRFQLCKYVGSGSTGAWEAVSGYEDIDLTQDTQKVLEKLSVGRYRLEETQAPAGYVVYTKFTYFNVGTDSSGSITVTLTDEDGTGPNSNTDASVSGSTITVTNHSGAALPLTGGPGTTIFYIIGSLLVIGCGIALAVRRRMGIR